MWRLIFGCGSTRIYFPRFICFLFDVPSGVYYVLVSFLQDLTFANLRVLCGLLEAMKPDCDQNCLRQKAMATAIFAAKVTKTTLPESTGSLHAPHIDLIENLVGILLSGTAIHFAFYFTAVK